MGHFGFIYLWSGRAIFFLYAGTTLPEDGNILSYVTAAACVFVGAAELALGCAGRACGGADTDAAAASPLPSAAEDKGSASLLAGGGAWQRHGLFGAAVSAQIVPTGEGRADTEASVPAWARSGGERGAPVEI